MHDKLSQIDLVDGEKIPVLCILDKGYRMRVSGWRAGKQYVLQPHFAESDRKFSGNETISSAGVASDRGGKERAV